MIYHYSKYRIEWIDILSDSGWATDKEFDRMKLASRLLMKVGSILKTGTDSIKIFASYDKDEDTNEITFGDRTMIPWLVLRKWLRLNNG